LNRTTPFDAELVELVGEVGEGGEVRRQLDRDRHLDRLADGGDDVERAPLDRLAGFPRLRRQVVDVELERVGAGLDHQLRRSRASRPRWCR